MQTDTMSAITPIRPQETLRLRFSFSCTVAIGASYRLMSEDRPAEKTAMKKMIAIR